MGETMSVYQVIHLLKKRLGLILGIMIIAALGAAIISYFFIPKIYQTSTQILVNQKSTEETQLSNLTIATDLQLVQTYSVIINSPVIVEQVIEELNLDLTFEQLNQHILVETAENSQLLSINVKDADPEAAVAIANKTAEVLQKETEKLMNIDNITILSPAKVPENPLPVQPNPFLNIAIATVAGLILGIGIAFLLEYLDTTIKNGQEIRALLGVPLIGTIPSITEKESKELNAPIAFKKKEA